MVHVEHILTARQREKNLLVLCCPSSPRSTSCHGVTYFYSCVMSLLKENLKLAKKGTAGTYCVGLVIVSDQKVGHGEQRTVHHSG